MVKDRPCKKYTVLIVKGWAESQVRSMVKTDSMCVYVCT